ncbi:TlpA family protein disulfide reductase [Flavobacterium sp. WC2509]|uniref:TlpA family protein disulfide reductase n=1 Tax=Flavobacterium sp. WC2509 TaxID=3461406 RepID=UPI0040444EEA
MKQSLLILFFTIIFSGSLHAQNQKSYLTSKLIAGCPTEIDQLLKQYGGMGITIESYSNLKTGIDSIKIVAGIMIKQGQRDCWISSYINNKLSSFEVVSLLKNESNQFPSNRIDISLGKSSKKISLELINNTSTNELQYLWYDNKDHKSKTATIINVNKALVKDKPFPSMQFTSLNGDIVSVKDFIGKIVVVNWWSIGCAPCRQEIPGLNTLVEKYKSNPNIIFLAVAWNNKNDLESHLKEHEFKYKQTFSDKEEIKKLFGNSFPVHIVVNPQGIITSYKSGGYKDVYKEIDNEIIKQQIGMK